MSLSLANKNNPCPICQNSTGKCRQGKEDLSYWQCMSYADAKKGETIRGYKCLGAINNGLWAQFRLDNSQEWTQQKRHEWQLENQRRAERKATENEKLAKEALPIEARDEAIRKFHKHFGLSARHREDLKARGLSDEAIENLLYFSITPDQEVPHGIPANLPGVIYGQIKAARTGYACVTFDPEGRATGWQVRLDDVQDNKYRWAKGARSSHLASGELPITSAYPVGDMRRQAIGVCEGISKPGIAANRLGQVFIGASSANFASSPEQTKEHLLAASQRLGTKQVEFAADAGAVSNPHILSSYRRSWELFAKLGYEVRVSWWGQIEKDTPDIDELQPEQIDQILLLRVSEFEAICREHGGLPKEGFARGIKRQIERGIQDLTEKLAPKPEKNGFEESEPDPDEYAAHLQQEQQQFEIELAQAKEHQKQYIKPIQELPHIGFHIIRRSQDELLERFDALGTKRGKEWLKLREFTPDVVIDSQYFDYDFKPEENLAINSGLGTGKSYFTNAKWLANPEEGAVLGGYRNCLNEQFCAKGKELNGRSWYQIQQDLKKAKDLALIADPESRIAGAVDSWIYFSPHHFEGKKVIFDEVESVAKHLNQSSTAVSFYRDTIKSRVSDALQNSSANLIADGNLRDFTTAYLEKLSGKKFTKILNKYTGNRGKIYLYNGSSRKRKATESDVEHGLASQIDEWISFDHKSDDYSKLHRIMMGLPTDIPLLILSDSQKKCDAWDEQLSALAWDEQLSALGRKVFRLDSTTSGTDLGLLFLRNPRKFILSHKINAVILSPSAESGVSIELLDELKRKIPGYFKYEFAFFFGTSVTDTQCQFLGRNRDPYVTKFVYVQSHSLPNARQITDEENSNDIFSGWIETIKDCASLSLEGIEEGEILKLAFEKVKAQLLDPHIQYESKLMLKESFERKYPRFCFEYAAREAGWDVITVESREDDLSDLRATQEEIGRKKAVAIFGSKTLSTTEADKLTKKLDKTPEERNQITKSRLLSRLPGIEQKIVTEKKKVTTPEQIQQIEESNIEKIVAVAQTPYEDWKATSQPIPEKGIELLIQKPAFNPDFIDKVTNQDRNFVSRLESQFFLNNPEVCKVVQQHKWHNKLNLLTDPDSTSLRGLPISRYRSKWLEVNTLYEMGIGFFLDPGNSWHNETPEAIAFWQKGKIPRNARNIGVKHEDDPCAYISKVLKKFELKTKGKQRNRPDKTRYREYSIQPLNSLSQAIYECVEQRISNQVNEFVFDWKKILRNSGCKMAEAPTQREPQSAHLPLDNLIKTREKVCVFQNQNAGGSSLVERMIELFSHCETPEDFALAIKGFAASPGQIEDAIALADSQPRRRQLGDWYQQLSDKLVGEAEVLATHTSSYRWAELPSVGTILEWVSGGLEKLVLKVIDADGSCQVKSLLSGLFTNTNIEQLRGFSP